MPIEVQDNIVIYDDEVLRVSADTTANRPASPVQGMIRFNTTDNSFEGYNGTEWGAIGGSSTGGGGGGLFTETTTGVWETPSITTATLDGDLVVTGDVTSQSDERLKENITSIDNALDIVENINGVYYNLKADPETRHVGLVAQNVEQSLPEAVRESNDYKSVAYGNIVGVLVEAIKELKKEIGELKRGV
jgi:hypothetical protein